MQNTTLTIKAQLLAHIAAMSERECDMLMMDINELVDYNFQAEYDNFVESKEIDGDLQPTEVVNMACNCKIGEQHIFPAIARIAAFTAEIV